MVLEGVAELRATLVGENGGSGVPSSVAGTHLVLYSEQATDSIAGNSFHTTDVSCVCSPRLGLGQWSR